MDLHKLLPFFGTGQLPVLSILGSAVLLGSHCMTAMFVKERVLIASSEYVKSLQRKLLWRF
jgi:hypothetical protein